MAPLRFVSSQFSKYSLSSETQHEAGYLKLYTLNSTLETFI